MQDGTWYLNMQMIVLLHSRSCAQGNWLWPVLLYGALLGDCCYWRLSTFDELWCVIQSPVAYLLALLLFGFRIFFIILLYVLECFVYMYVCIACISDAHRGQKRESESISSLGTGVTDGCQLPWGCWEVYPVFFKSNKYTSPQSHVSSPSTHILRDLCFYKYVCMCAVLRYMHEQMSVFIWFLCVHIRV